MVERDLVTNREIRQSECQKGVSSSLDAATPRKEGQSEGNGRLAEVHRSNSDGMNLEATELVENVRFNAAEMSDGMPGLDAEVRK